MIWLKSPQSQLSKTFYGLKIHQVLRKLWARMCVYVLFPSSTSSTYIALQPLCVFDLSSTSSTYFNIHLLWLVLISSTSSTYKALQPLCVFDLSSTPSTLLWSLVLIYLNASNIKQYVWLVLISSTSSTYIALQPLCVFNLSSTPWHCFDLLY